MMSCSQLGQMKVTECVCVCHACALVCAFVCACSLVRVCESERDVFEVDIMLLLLVTGVHMHIL